MNRNHYYQEGWLSTANLRGVVGVTYTTSHCGGSGFLEPSCEKYLNLEPPNRTNYNLRGHRAEVSQFNALSLFLVFLIQVIRRKTSFICFGKSRNSKEISKFRIIYTVTAILICFLILDFHPYASVILSVWMVL